MVIPVFMARKYSTPYSCVNEAGQAQSVFYSVYSSFAASDTLCFDSVCVCAFSVKWLSDELRKSRSACCWNSFTHFHMTSWDSWQAQEKSVLFSLIKPYIYELRAFFTCWYLVEFRVSVKGTKSACTKR